MRGIEGQVQEHRTPAEVLLQEANRFATEDLSAVLPLVLLGAVVPAKHGGDPVPLVRVVVDTVVAVTVEEVETALKRQVASGLAHVPLADNATRVADGPQHITDRDLLRIETERHLGRDSVFIWRVAMAVIDQVVADHVVKAVALRVAAGENTAA